MERFKVVLLIAVMLVIALGLVGWFVSVAQPGISVGSYTGNVGEVTRDVLVGQNFISPADNLSGLGIQFATYSNRSNTHLVELHIRNSITSTTDLRVISVNAEDLRDNQLFRFSFEPITQSAGQAFFFYVVSPQSVPGNAITVDIHNRDPYHEGTAFIVKNVAGSLTDSAILATAGKVGADLTFATYHNVPLGVAVWRSIRDTTREIITTWPDRKDDYIRWLQFSLPGLFFVFLSLKLTRAESWLSQYIATKKGTAVLLGVLLLLGFGLRMLYATVLPLTSDEGNYLYDAAALSRGVLAGGDGYVKAPLVIVWLMLWQTIFGQTILAGRIAMVILGTLTILPLYSIARELYGQRAGIMSAAAWALLGAPVVFAIYVHTQSLAVFCAAAGVAAVLVARRQHWRWFVLGGVLLGLGVASRKSVIALGLIPLVVVLIDVVPWRLRLNRLLLIGAGFAVVLSLFLGFAYTTYGPVGVREALGLSSAEDGRIAKDPVEIENERIYSLRGMTPFFRESLPLIVLSLLGLGSALETLAQAFVQGWGRLRGRAGEWFVTKIVWLVPLALFWWAKSFFFEYEGSPFISMGGMRVLWLGMAGLLILISLLPTRAKSPLDVYAALRGSLVPVVWFTGLVLLYLSWIKFHANYIVEFLPPLAVLAGFGVLTIWQRLRLPTRFPMSMVALSSLRVVAGGIVLWTIVLTGFITFTYEHTGTFAQGSVQEAAAWAAANIPLDEPIFTGAAVVPYLSGHRTSLDIAHPLWYVYEWIRKDTVRLNTFLPPADEMVQAFRDAKWFLRERQTSFAFITEYSEIEAGLERDFVEVHAVENGSNTLLFYQRIR